MCLPAMAQTVVSVPASTASKTAVEYFALSSAKVVKGAPFSAEGISESVQVLPDGNRITRRVTSRMYRDGEGRFRREGESGGISASGGSFGYSTVNGNLFAVFGFQDSISISDPVENVSYTLFPSTKTVRRYKSPKILAESTIFGSDKSYAAVLKSQIESSAQATKGTAVTIAKNLFVNDYSKSESLGTKSFEGIEAEGNRTVVTIPAGKIGNERPIEITTERWYSKELDLTVYSRHYDPRFGEQTYRLINISRSEPDATLFTVPSDYKIVSEASGFTYTTKPK